MYSLCDYSCMGVINFCMSSVFLKAVGAECQDIRSIKSWTFSTFHYWYDLIFVSPDLSIFSSILKVSILILNARTTTTTRNEICMIYILLYFTVASYWTQAATLPLINISCSIPNVCVRRISTNMSTVNSRLPECEWRQSFELLSLAFTAKLVGNLKLVRMLACTPLG